MKNITIQNYTYQDTSHPNVKRFIDRSGNWEYYWLVKEKKFVKAVNHILRLGYPKGKYFMEWLKKANPEEVDRRLKTAGEEGTRSHQAIRDLSAGHRVTMASRYHNDITKKDELLNDDEWDNLQAFINFCNTYNPEFITDEQTVYTEEYAGTFDWIGTLLVPEGDKNFPAEVRGKRVLALPLDWKTGSGLWPEYELQVAAYYKAIKEMELYTEFTNFGKDLPIFGVLVRLGTRHKIGYEVQVLDESTLAYKYGVFAGCINTANDQEPTFEPEIKEIPYSFHYKMPVAKVASFVEKKKVLIEKTAKRVSQSEGITMKKAVEIITGKGDAIEAQQAVLELATKTTPLKKKGRGRPRKIKT